MRIIRSACLGSAKDARAAGLSQRQPGDAQSALEKHIGEIANAWCFHFLAGQRGELIEPLKAGVPEAIRFFEVAPENWTGIGGK